METPKRMRRRAMIMMSRIPHTSLSDETIDAIEKLLAEVLFDSMHRLETRINKFETMTADLA